MDIAIQFLYTVSGLAMSFAFALSIAQGIKN